MEPISLTLAALCGVGVRAYRNRHPSDRRQADKRADTVLPASWEQLAEINGLAYIVATRDDRHVDHVLDEYGVFTYAGGRTRTMVRKQLTRSEANKVIARIKKRERVTFDPNRDAFIGARDPLAPRPDEEPF